MKRAFLLAMFLTILLVFFAACDSNDTPPVDTSRTETSAVVTTPVATEPPESTVQETDEPGTVPAETDSTVTDPMDTDPVVTDSTYSIYIDDTLFNDIESHYMVTEQYTYYQLYIKNNLTGEILKYGTDNMICKSADESIVSVGPTGTMVIHLQGTTQIDLIQDNRICDSIMVHGCVADAKLIIVQASKPTCTANGGTGGEYCSGCYEIFLNSETIPAKGHSFVEGACENCWSVDNQGSSYKIQNSCIWYSEYYDYIINYQDDWYIYNSQIADNVKSPYYGAISHVLLLTPEDAEWFAALYSKDATADAWVAVIEQLMELGIDKIMKASDMEKVLNKVKENLGTYSQSFLSKVITSDEQEVTPFAADVAKGLIITAVEKSLKKVPIGAIIDWTAVLFEFTEEYYEAKVVG